jgi:putative transposase
MQRRITFAPDEYYHIYSRGTDRRSIFLDEKDYQRFCASLYIHNNQEQFHFTPFLEPQGRSLSDVFDVERPLPLCNLGVYCLMPNHFHLLVRADKEGGVSAFMKKLLTGYSMYFNVKNEREGTLFSGRFKAEHVTSDEYLHYLYVYIHLNPIKLIEPLWKEKGIQNFERAKLFLKNYHYSSYIDYLSTGRREEKILNKITFPDYFEIPHEFEQLHDYWLKYRPDRLVEQLTDKVGP